MTDEQINRAIAEACGWKEITESVAPEEFQRRSSGMLRDKYGNRTPHKQIPDYVHDLNAMHKAEKTIFPYYARVYSNKLAKATGAEMSDDTDYFCATARQRAEAFLRTLGKWEEVQL